MIAISYRRDDSLPIAGRLYDRLQARFGKPNVFMDFDSIRPGLDFRSQIRETIDRAEVVVALIGPHWFGADANTDLPRRIDDPNDFVRLEITHALKRDIPIIPVLINNTPMPKPETLPEDMRGLVFRHALPLDSGLDFHQHADRVIAGVSNLVGPESIAEKDGETSKQVTVPDPSRRGVGIVLTTIALLAVVGGGAWFVLARTTKTAAPVPVAPVTSRASSASVPPAVVVEKPWVEISSRPPGARVLSNGIVLGITPLRRDDLGTGPAKFVLMNPGYLPREVNVTIDPSKGFKDEISLSRAASLYVGEIKLRETNGDIPPRPIAITLQPDLTSGTMTQSSKYGDFVVRFTGVWEGTELHAVTGDVVAQPASLQWAPESFVLQFSDDSARARYQCVAGGKTYTADLSAESEFLAHVAHAYKGIVSTSNTPIKITMAADRRSGMLTETSKSGDTVVAFTGIWEDKTLHAVTGDVVSKPERVQWKPESFTLQAGDNGGRMKYTCNDDGRILAADLAPLQ